MKRRTCGTCGFFEEGELAGTGWCNHPQRRVSIDLKIMVRKGELACRDGWSRDLWAPRADAGSTGQPADNPSQGPVPPISPEEMTLLVDSGQVDVDASPRPTATAPVDVVVGETPALPPPDERATLLSHDPRAAIEAARQRHLAKTATGGQSAAETDPKSSGSMETPIQPDQSPPAHVNRRASGPFRPLPDLPRGRSSQPARAARDVNAEPRKSDEFSTVPEVRDGVSLPRRELRHVAPQIAGATEELPEDPRRASLQRLRSRQAQSPVNPFPRRADPRTEIGADPPLDDQPAREMGGRTWRGLIGRDRQAHRYQRETAAVAWDEPYQEDVQDAGWRAEHDGDMDAVVMSEAHDLETPGDDSQFEYALAGAIDDDFDIQDTAVHVAPDVPRMCKTCRDFRPADSGERGWCNNRWAFSHRRMVDADELPCESSLGCWWLPHDEIWLSSADVAGHSEPTPLVEHWLGRRDLERRRQGS